MSSKSGKESLGSFVEHKDDLNPPSTITDRLQKAADAVIKAGRLKEASDACAQRQETIEGWAKGQGKMRPAGCDGFARTLEAIAKKGSLT